MSSASSIGSSSDLYQLFRDFGLNKPQKGMAEALKTQSPATDKVTSNGSPAGSGGVDSDGDHDHSTAGSAVDTYA